MRASERFIGNSSELIAQLSKKQKLFNEKVAASKKDCIDETKFASGRSFSDISEDLTNYQSPTDSFRFEMQRAYALIACKAPKKAQKILHVINPETDSQKREWSLLLWKASNASMDHFNAALALRSLSSGILQNLDQQEITVGYRSGGAPLTRFALDLLAEHERLNGRCDASAKVLLAGRKSGALGAVRMAKAAQCLEGLNVDQRRNLLELALSEANAEKAWWLVGDILRLQIMFKLASSGDAQALKKQLETHAKDLDDRYTQWELIRIDNSREEERILLEEQLRSPMEPAPGT